jgi:hypothetical protein
MREQVMLVVEQHINAGRHNDAKATDSSAPLPLPAPS